MTSFFDKNYFDNYGGKGISYDKSSLRYGGKPKLIKKVLSLLDTKPKSFYDVGCSTGKFMLDMNKIFKFSYMRGCEISEYAVNLSPIKNLINKSDLKSLKENGSITYDLVYANILMYIPDKSLKNSFKKIRDLGHANSIYCFWNYYDTVTGYYFVDPSGKLHNREDLRSTQEDSARVQNQSKMWWLKKIEENGFKIVYEDSEGLLYCTQAPYWNTSKIDSTVTQLTVKEIIKYNMFNLRSPFKVVTMGTTLLFYWHTDGMTAIEFGPLVHRNYRYREVIIPRVTSILLSKQYLPVLSILLRPVDKCMFIPGFKSWQYHNAWYMGTDLDVTSLGENITTFKSIIRSI